MKIELQMIAYFKMSLTTISNNIITQNLKFFFHSPLIKLFSSKLNN
jgi:hypothetical protein